MRIYQKKYSYDYETVKKIIYDYTNNIKLKTISKQYNLPIYIVRYILRKNNIPPRNGIGRRKYFYNENIFKKIDNEEKAYWLGLLMADGWINGAENGFGISLTDGDMILKLKEFMGDKNTPINNKPNCRGIFNSKIIQFCSIKIVKDLSRYGMVKNKTKITQILNISSKFIKDFIRGYFDGDGCIYPMKNSNGGEISITSCSFKILQQIESYLSKAGVSNISMNTIKKTYGELRIRNQSDLIKFYSLIYKDATIFFQRKYNKFNLIIQRIKNNMKRKTGQSKYIGVSVCKNVNQKRRYSAYITINGNQKKIGTFVTEIEAAKRYNEEATKENFPEWKINKII